MGNLAFILTGLQAVIAVHAARNRALTVLLVAMWGRIARTRTRLERLIARWRAGILPAPRKSRAGQIARPTGAVSIRVRGPNGRGWLLGLLGYEVVPFGNGLRTLLSEPEWVEFLAAVPQARRILRPLVRMLSIDPLPEVILKVRRVAPAIVPAPAVAMAGVVVSPGSQFLRG